MPLPCPRRGEKVEWRDRDAVKAFYADPESRRNRCAALVGDTAFALGEILDEAV